jgi:hypothetical protein
MARMQHPAGTLQLPTVVHHPYLFQPGRLRRCSSLLCLPLLQLPQDLLQLRTRLPCRQLQRLGLLALS